MSAFLFGYYNVIVGRVWENARWEPVYLFTYTLFLIWFDEFFKSLVDLIKQIN